MQYIRREKEIHTAFRYNGENIQDIEKILLDTNLFVSSYNKYSVKISKIGDDVPKYLLGYDVWAVLKNSSNQLRLLHKLSFHAEFTPTNKSYKYIKKDHKIFNALRYTGDNVEEIETLLSDTNIRIVSQDGERIMFGNHGSGSSKGFAPNGSWVMVKRQSALILMNDELFHNKFTVYTP